MVYFAVHFVMGNDEGIFCATLRRSRKEGLISPMYKDSLKPRKTHWSGRLLRWYWALGPPLKRQLVHCSGSFNAAGISLAVSLWIFNNGWSQRNQCLKYLKIEIETHRSSVDCFASNSAIQWSSCRHRTCLFVFYPNLKRTVFDQSLSDS